MRALTLYPLTPGTVTTIDTGGGPGTIGTVVLKNLSPYECLVAFDAGGAPGAWLVAHTADRYDVNEYPGWDGIVRVTPQAIASNTNNAPSYVLVGETYAPGERVPGIYPLAIDRLSNVGNQVSTTGTNNVINDGQNAPTEVIEATPKGSGTSELLWNNDGSGVFGGGNDVVNNAGVFTSMAADAIPTAAIAAGTLDSDVAVPAANVTPGTLQTGQYGFEGGTNNAALSVHASNQAGADVMFLSDTPVSGQNADLLQMQRITNQPHIFTFGLDNLNGFYLYDNTSGGYVLQNAGYDVTDAFRGRIPTMQTNGGGNSGHVIYSGTDDPGANAGEGDLWVAG